MEESILYAKKYLEDLLSFFGLNIDVYATREDEVIALSVPSTHMNGFLIGMHGDTMRALQYMVSTALKNNDYELTRVNVDIADYKKQRQDRLAETSLQWIDKVKNSGKQYELQPMNPADRRVVHKVADEHGLSTESVGFGRDRRVIIKPYEEITEMAVAEVVEDVEKAEPTEEKPTKEVKKATKAKKDVSSEVLTAEEPKADKKPAKTKKTKESK
jgi:spoIIIJ-associated protein